MLASLIIVYTTVIYAVLPPPDARADDSDFYSGKAISIIIPQGPGGAYDLFGRLVSRHLAKFIAGNPTIVVRNMPGANGLVATNHSYNVAQQDGTTLIIIQSTFAFDQLLNVPQIKYDARRFNAIGRLTDTTSVIASWHTSAIKSATDLLTKPAIVGSSSLSDIFALRYKTMNHLLGAHIKLLSGYQSARDYVLASQRGEVDGFWIPFITLKQSYPSELRSKQFSISVQSAMARDGELLDVPTMQDLSDNAEVKLIFRYLTSNDEIGRSLFTTPGVPPTRVAALRSAFQKMLDDASFKDEADKSKLPLSPRTADEIQRVVLGTFEAPQEVVTKIRDIASQ
jgi:tripartite-type tricarboxylate transporter receptor subunit TctC